MPRRTAKRTTSHGKRPNRPRNSLPVYDCSHGIPKGCGKGPCIVVINGHRRKYDPAKHGDFHGWLGDAFKKVGKAISTVYKKIAKPAANFLTGLADKHKDKKMRKYLISKLGKDIGGKSYQIYKVRADAHRNAAKQKAFNLLDPILGGGEKD